VSRGTGRKVAWIVKGGVCLVAVWTWGGYRLSSLFPCGQRINFRCRLVPQGGGDGPVSLVVARLGCALGVDAVDVEVAETGTVGYGALEAEVLAEVLPLASHRA